MKSFLLSIFCFVFFLQSKAQMALQWANTSENEYASGRSIAIDNAGNTYTFGVYDGTIRFNTQNGITEYTSLGFKDMFLQKTLADGSIAWVKSFGGVMHELAVAVAVDTEGNIYTCGEFNGPIDLDPNEGETIIEATNDYDVFLQKLSPDGTLIWATSISGTGEEYVSDLITSPSGDIYLSGAFEENTDFSLSSSDYFLTAEGIQDAYLCRIGSNGNLKWVKQWGNDATTEIFSLALDEDSNVVLAGRFENTMDFDPNDTAYILGTAGQQESFLCKLNSNGSFIWANNFAANTDARINDIAIDNNQYIVACGHFSNEGDFAAGDSYQWLSPEDGQDIFIAQYDESGAFVWARNSGGYHSESAKSVLVNADNDIFISGYFLTLCNFDLGVLAQECIVTSNGLSDMFLAKYSSNGAFSWYKRIGGYQTDSMNDMVMDAEENLYITGYYNDALDFDPSPGNYEMGVEEENAAFTMKLSPCEAYHTDLVISACNDFLWDATGFYYETSGYHVAELVSTEGCDSIITLDLTISYVDDRVAKDGIQLSAYAAGPTIAYQWLDCSNDMAPIPGATEQSFIATESGEYALELTDGVCTTITDCESIYYTAVEPLEKETAFTIVPNPSHGEAILLNPEGQLLSIKVYNAQGMLLNTHKSTNTSITGLFNSLAQGSYYIAIRSEEFNFIQSFIKL